MNFLKRFFRKEDGQDLVEYGLLAAFISVVTVAILRALGPLVVAMYGIVQTALT